MTSTCVCVYIYIYIYIFVYIFYLLLKGYSTPKWELFFSPCRSNTVKALFIFGTQFKVFWMKTGRLLTRGRPIDQLIFFLMNQHRPIVLHIRQINIQARLQATRDAASCGKQIAIPLAQRITLWCPLCLLTPSAVITAPRDASFNISLYHTAPLPAAHAHRKSRVRSNNAPTRNVYVTLVYCSCLQ